MPKTYEEENNTKSTYINYYDTNKILQYNKNKIHLLEGRQNVICEIINSPANVNHIIHDYMGLKFHVKNQLEDSDTSQEYISDVKVEMDNSINLPSVINQIIHDYMNLRLSIPTPCDGHDKCDIRCDNWTETKFSFGGFRDIQNVIDFSNFYVSVINKDEIMIAPIWQIEWNIKLFKINIKVFYNINDINKYKILICDECIDYKKNNYVTKEDIKRQIKEFQEIYSRQFNIYLSSGVKNYPKFTFICPHHIAGRCKFKKKCTYIHLKEKFKKKICRNYLKYKRTPERNTHKYNRNEMMSKCKYGEQCIFWHVRTIWGVMKKQDDLDI